MQGGISSVLYNAVKWDAQTCKISCLFALDSLMPFQHYFRSAMVTSEFYHLSGCCNQYQAILSSFPLKMVDVLPLHRWHVSFHICRQTRPGKPVSCSVGH